MARKILFMLVVSLAAASTSLLALGLGEIKLKSGLNQPLNAEITLLSIRGEADFQLRGKLGSIADFDRSGIERTYFLGKIRFKTTTKDNGDRVLQLTTQEPVKEPFLNFLVDLEWPNGRLLREYTVLLDPPIFDDAPKTTVAPAIREPRQPVQRPQQTYVAPEPRWEGEIYGPTSSSDTLWGIAAKVKPSDVTMQQAMIAIFEANPKAFMRGNINILKRGADIRVPDSDRFQQVTQREALRMIAAHNDNWKSGRKTAPRVVMDTSADSSMSNQTVSQNSDIGRLSLSTDSTDTGSTGSSVSDLLTEEENEVLKQQNESLTEQSRADAEKIEQLERLLELKNTQLANIQNREAEQTITTDSSTDTVGETTTENSNSAEVIEPKVETKIVDVTPTSIAPVKESASFLDRTMDGAYNLYLLIAGAIIILFLIPLFRRKSQGVDYKDAVAASASSTATAVERVSPITESADEVLAQTDAMDSEFLDIDNESFEETEVETSETSDPLGEADIYLAYGKYEQAENLLLTAIDENPERLELNSKLLECYAEMNDKEKFDAQLVSISTAVASDAELRSYIDELYQSTWPQKVSDDTESEQEFAYDEPTEEDFEVASDDEFSIEDDFDIDIEEPVVDAVQSANTDFEDVEELPSTEDVFGNEDIAELDISDDDEYEDEDEDDVADDVDTQLDLARAYVEMGDIEGTREIINEILETGSEEQCNEAQAILDSLKD